ncbi:putative RNA-directed DNA polymerase [Aphis craccivora]|uniref:Putative RNA-directed DNA polymerase n=1 Tax=Aphis craccivora TaxID=307492 RepID=A0A6G0W2I9_APHCR|nr:putative RNA-directed DNA polymerase [Aphis craccivora]
MHFNDKEANDVYTHHLFTNPKFNHNFSNSIPNICNIHISLMDIFNELDNLNIHLCPGPDNISPKFLYNCHFI